MRLENELTDILATINRMWCDHMCSKEIPLPCIMKLFALVLFWCCRMTISNKVDIGNSVVSNNIDKGYEDDKNQIFGYFHN